MTMLKLRGWFETFICKGCGYTEWYARELDEIEPDAAKGIHLLDARGPDAGEPFR
jgi:predicted nucleic-acid-binding Zn-ribbon protein